MNIMLYIIVISIIIGICILVIHINKKSYEEIHKNAEFRKNIKVGDLVKVVPSIQSTAFSRIIEIDEKIGMVVIKMYVTKDEIYPR